MTDDSQTPESLSTLSPGGESGAGFTGVFPAPSSRSGVEEAPDRGPREIHVVGQFHGILTGQSDPTWPDFGTAFFDRFYSELYTDNSEYFALPLPRIEALRNRRQPPPTPGLRREGSRGDEKGIS